VVEAASNGASALLNYYEDLDTYWSDSNCNFDYSSLPDANRFNKSSKEGCKAECEDNWWCTNFTYYPSSGSCYLFNRHDSSTAAETQCSSSEGAISGYWSSS